ncbi:hypothetical protein PVAG01_09577 [Phlyctema vagabunda]|uniref:AA1-like domain-containing protein n=1 Tax=Phlyctema vagabunda TaxID=108571 RepID=A0ABR4P7T6_9HELO
MRFLLAASFVLSFIFSVNALLSGLDTESATGRLARTRLARHATDLAVEAHSVRRSLDENSKRARPIRDFHVSDISTNDFPTETAWNRSISFYFTDLNSNASTICMASWEQTSSTNKVPMDYVLCNFTTKPKEFFNFKFDSYTSLGVFSLTMTHRYSDPVNFPPPWDIVQYFSSSTAFKLQCDTKDTAFGPKTSCATVGTLTAVVNGVAN